jgi:uncharacterized damage-inducible protein DinB
MPGANLPFDILFDHALWADERARREIADMAPGSTERAQATRIYAHLAGANHTWLSRLEGREPVHGVWPDLSLDDASALTRECISAMRALAADPSTLERQVEYRNTKGETFRNTLGEVLIHVAMHMQYHRGQLALLARQGGGTPIATDYIVYVRELPRV